MTARRVDGDQRRSEARGAPHRSADRVRNVVELEVEKDVERPRSHRADRLGAGGGGELAADLEEIAAVAKHVDDGNRFGERRRVERNNNAGVARRRHGFHSSVPITSRMERIPFCAHQCSSPLTTRSALRGSRIEAVPSATSEAPATRYCNASSALVMPPTPITGTFTARATRQVARTPTGINDTPLTPPLPNPSTGRRVSRSITRPGIVFTTVIPSAPASTATDAVRAMSVKVGDSFTNTGRRVASRARPTTSRSD